MFLIVAGIYTSKEDEHLVIIEKMTDTHVVFFRASKPYRPNRKRRITRAEFLDRYELRPVPSRDTKDNHEDEEPDVNNEVRRNGTRGNRRRRRR